jgi:hypothetical protein
MPNTSQLTLQCVRYEIKTGGVRYPFFIGAVSAKELVDYAIAPSFKEQTKNYEIAHGALHPPTKNWQRPLDIENVTAITNRFDTDGEIMPNPVLLAVNPDFKDSFRSTELSIDTVPTGIWEVKIQRNDIGGDKPLWIIDGQHRVAGLAGTRRIDPPLPFVILHSSEDSYRPEILAKIFAQVTTLTKPLNSIHNAWMQFIFKLGNFVEGQPDWLAMKSTALLCETQMFRSVNNPFYDKIVFNPKIDLSEIHPGGFAYDAEQFYELIRDYYFEIQGNVNHLEPRDLAEELSLAIFALIKTAKPPTLTSAFFVDNQHQQKYFRDGFIVGVCSYLLRNGAPQDWISVLKTLNFHKTDWDISSWVESTSGTAGTTSKKIANKVFESVFSEGKLPDNVTDIPSYLQGEECYLWIYYKVADENDELVARGAQSQVEKCKISGLKTVIVSVPSSTRWIKILAPSKNYYGVDIVREGDAYNPEYGMDKFKRGRTFTTAELSKLKKELKLEVKADLYGGGELQRKLKIKFDG